MIPVIYPQIITIGLNSLYRSIVLGFINEKGTYVYRDVRKIFNVPLWLRCVTRYIYRDREIYEKTSRTLLIVYVHTVYIHSS